MPNLKVFARDLLPRAYQVPAKYWASSIRGHLEPEMDLLPKLVRCGDLVVDVGGNRGTYAYRLAAIGAVVQVFEPNPACNAVLSAWAGSRRDVVVHAVALSSEAGEATLIVPIGAGGVEHDSSGSLEHDTAGEARRVTVPTRTLDSYGFDKVALVKIDVEGHEASVIRGARDMIARCKPAILVEIEQRHLTRPIADVFDEISTLGYDGYFWRDGRTTPIAQFDLATDQAIANFDNGGPYRNNFLFLDPEAIAAGRYADVLRAS